MKPELQKLQNEIEGIKARDFYRGAKPSSHFINFDDEGLNNVLGGGIALGHLNEICANSYFNEIAALSLTLSMCGQVLQKRHGDIVIVIDEYFAREWGEIYSIGLVKFGIAPERILLITPKNKFLHSCLSDALKTEGLGAIIGAVSRRNSFDLLASRKLQLSASEGLGAVFLISGFGASGILNASLRLGVGAKINAGQKYKWGIEIQKSRFGPHRNFDLEYDYENHRLYMPPVLESRTPHQRVA